MQGTANSDLAFMPVNYFLADSQADPGSFVSVSAVQALEMFFFNFYSVIRDFDTPCFLPLVRESFRKLIRPKNEMLRQAQHDKSNLLVSSSRVAKRRGDPEFRWIASRSRSARKDELCKAPLFRGKLLKCCALPLPGTKVVEEYHGALFAPWAMQYWPHAEPTGCLPFSAIVICHRRASGGSIFRILPAAVGHPSGVVSGSAMPRQDFFPDAKILSRFLHRR